MTELANRTTIDAFAHVVPPAYHSALVEHVGRGHLLVDQINRLTTLTDVNRRLAIMDEYGIDQQVLVPASPGVETVADPVGAARLARLANDELAEIVDDHPNRFYGVAMVPMNDPEEMIAELRRAVETLDLSGVLLYTSVDERASDDSHLAAAGKPIDTAAFESFYETAAQLDVPIWLHPNRPQTKPDYVGELDSKYLVWQLFGWPFETTKAMTRLIFGGVLDRHPDLDFVVHHAGGMVPFFENRIEHVYSLAEHLSGETIGADLSAPPLEYFKRFTVDTATMGATHALYSAYECFGPENLVFGTDMPFDTEGGETFTRETARAVSAMDVSDADKARIYSGNIERLLSI